MLVQEQSVTRAALRLGVTQSAASNMLARLRHVTGDPVLVRAGNTMLPTERATDLATAVWRHIEGVGEALASGAGFDPTIVERPFRIAMPDYLAQALMPELARRFASAAPRAQLIVRHASAEDFDRLLDSGEAELVVSMIRTCRAHHRSSPLVEEHYLCLADPASFSDASLDLSAYLERGHVFVSFTGDLTGTIDAALERQGLARRIAIATPSFALVPALLKGSRHLATVPSPFARHCERIWGLRALPLPFAVDAIRVSMAWHRRGDADPALTWFREAVAACATVAPDLQDR